MVNHRQQQRQGVPPAVSLIVAVVAVVMIVGALKSRPRKRTSAQEENDPYTVKPEDDDKTW